MTLTRYTNGPWAAGILSAALSLGALPALAHFQLVNPGNSARNVGEGALDMAIVFTHPFGGGPTMAMGQPVEFFMDHKRNAELTADRTDLMEFLVPQDFTGSDGVAGAAFRATIPARAIRSMGDYVISMVPSPYYESAEDSFIQQITKTVVNVGGVPTAWDQPVEGLPVQIVPLDKPYANWKGGVFRGVVLAEGKPVPFAYLEVEYLNHDLNADLSGWQGEAKLEPPKVVLEAMSIRADASGTFTLGLPKAGWWGIGALDLMPGATHQGKPLSVDAVIWVEVTDIE